MIDVGRHLRDRGVSLEAAALRIGIPLERMQAIIGGSDMTLRELRRLGELLGRPVSELAAPEVNRLRIMLRRSAGRTFRKSPDLDDLAARFSGAADLLRTRSTVPAFISLFRDRIHHTGARTDEDYASTFRSLFFHNDQASPLHELPMLASELGVAIIRRNVKDIEGASAIVDGCPIIILSPRFQGRMLLTLAHELGHLLFHHDLAKNSALVDPSVDERGAGSSRERAASAFAFALLMPQSSVSTALRMVRAHLQSSDEHIAAVEIAYVARIFGVSFIAAGVRMEAMELLPSGGTTAFLKDIEKTYDSPEKFADSMQVSPRPDIRFPAVSPNLLDAAVEAVASGSVSTGFASRSLGISPEELFIWHAGGQGGSTRSS